MTRLLLLILIALFTFAIILYVERPDLIKNFWIWAIGFSSVIIRVFVLIKHALTKHASHLSDTVAAKKEALQKKYDIHF